VTGRSLGVPAFLMASFVSLSSLLVQSTIADDSDSIVTVDHYVSVHSSVPSMAGQITQMYVRERTRTGIALRPTSLANRVVLFIHGRGTPAEVAFDVPYQDYSWMTYLAQAGFDVFAMDVTGYGRSTRPPLMNDPCSLSPKQQVFLGWNHSSTQCTGSYPGHLTTLASDWNDISAVVEYIRALRHVERVSLIGWSMGGPRAGGYAAQHPDKVQKLVLLAPAYNMNPRAEGVPMNTQSFEEFAASWDAQVGCLDQIDPAARDSVWLEMMKSDPLGATWGSGVRRAPVDTYTATDWNSAVVAKLQMPMLLISGEYDKTVPPAHVRELYGDLTSHQNVFVDLACSSHNALWEKNHLLLFRASLEWLTLGSVNGKQEGTLRLGYEGPKQSPLLRCCDDSASSSFWTKL
jgi:pimeloyl-ACP methyl ester carboxylesterase